MEVITISRRGRTFVVFATMIVLTIAVGVYVIRQRASATQKGQLITEFEGQSLAIPLVICPDAELDIDETVVERDENTEGMIVLSVRAVVSASLEIVETYYRAAMAEYGDVTAHSFDIPNGLEAVEIVCTNNNHSASAKLYAHEDEFTKIALHTEVTTEDAPLYKDLVGQINQRIHSDRVLISRIGELELRYPLIIPSGSDVQTVLLHSERVGGSRVLFAGVVMSVDDSFDDTLALYRAELQSTARGRTLHANHQERTILGHPWRAATLGLSSGLSTATAVIKSPRPAYPDVVSSPVAKRTLIENNVATPVETSQAEK